MKDSLNLDIESYNADELMQLFNIQSSDNKELIADKYICKQNSLEIIQDKDFKSTLQTFFKTAYEKILQMGPFIEKKHINETFEKKT